MWCRRRASADPATIIPATTTTDKTKRRAIREHSHLHHRREMMITADAVKAGIAHKPAFHEQAVGLTPAFSRP
jgi:hypothetical protein